MGESLVTCFRNFRFLGPWSQKRTYGIGPTSLSFLMHIWVTSFRMLVFIVPNVREYSTRCFHLFLSLLIEKTTTLFAMCFVRPRILKSSNLSTESCFSVVKTSPWKHGAIWRFSSICCKVRIEGRLSMVAKYLYTYDFVSEVNMRGWLIVVF